MDEQNNLTIPDDKLKVILECMLFVTPQPLTSKHVATSLKIDEADVERVMHELRLDYGDRGLQIVRVAGGYQMCTRPEYSEYISQLLKPERARLSRAGLETIAIIAYRQPITQPEIDAIRGVNSDGVVKTLLEKNLVKQDGRKETAGRPILYATTDEFLNYFGLSDLSELPELADAEALQIELPEQAQAASEAEENAPQQDSDEAAAPVEGEEGREE